MIREYGIVGGIIRSDTPRGGAILVARQLALLGIPRSGSGTLTVSNKPKRGFQRVVFRNINSSGINEGWCRQGFEELGIIPREGGKLWIKFEMYNSVTSIDPRLREAGVRKRV